MSFIFSLIGSNDLCPLHEVSALISVCHNTHVCLCFGARIYMSGDLTGDSSTISLQAKKNYKEEPLF